jgi:hypothetical protein
LDDEVGARYEYNFLDFEELLAELERTGTYSTGVMLKYF